MQLPEELEEGFWQEVRAYEEAKQMPYITSVERIGMKKGIEQGMQQGTRRGLLRGIEVGLELKFGSEGLRILPEISQIEDVDQLRAVCEGLTACRRRLTAAPDAEAFGSRPPLI